MSENELPYSTPIKTTDIIDTLDSNAPNAPTSPPENCKQLATRITAEMHKAIVGQEDLIELLVVALLANGHVLLEGVPGTAKTLAVRTLARVFSATFSRIQFTPDLMPSDILGVNIYDPRTQEFRVRKGPIFAGLVLADEINRTPPKTQSALLEAMEERKVTIDGVSYVLPEPFLVCATQNPVEYEGTYPLPEAQLDRFMLQINISYLSEEQEVQILTNTLNGFSSQNLDTARIEQVVNTEDLGHFKIEVSKTIADVQVREYIVKIIRATRTNKFLLLGASPRACITLLNASRALAAVRGRDFVTPDDVKTLSGPVLRHRLMVRSESEIEGYTADRILTEILKNIEVPR